MNETDNPISFFFSPKKQEKTGIEKDFGFWKREQFNFAFLFYIA